MSRKRIRRIERRIDRIKRALLEIGPMRPGSLTRQYKDTQHHGAYWQISYTRRMKKSYRVRPPGMDDGDPPPDRDPQALQESG
jgi:hypothetical protein